MPVSSFPIIDVDWGALDALARDLEVRAGVTESYLADAATAWQRFGAAYREPATQDQVHTALDSLADPMAQWRTSLTTAAGIIRDFASAGRPLGDESKRLAAEQPERWLSADDDDTAAASALAAFNERAEQLTKQWNALEQETVAGLAGISGGTGSGLPMTAVPGSAALPSVNWPGLTSTLDERFGMVTPAQLLASLRGLDRAELQAWSAANPEAAALLAANKMMGPFPGGSPEAAMAAVMNDSLSKEGVAAIRNAWMDLSPSDQEKLLLLYPAVFGALNGVPFASRAHANTVTVAGYRHTVAQDLAALKEPQLADYGYGHGASSLYLHDHEEWQKERERLENQLKGLDFAISHGSQVVLASLEGDGRMVTMKGTPSDAVTTAAVLVPGTGANMGSLESYTGRLNAIDGDAGVDKLSFYWQGTDLPDELHHNLTSSYNEEGGPLLAAFDYALDLEVPADARSTYIGYSAGGSLLGTGEREGLDSTNILYVAPAGTGHEVSSPQDTANPDAHRYWVQTRSDPIVAAQVAGGGFHGGSFWTGGDPKQQMGAVRLESGFADPTKPDSLMEGHSDYFTKGSTAAANMQSVIEGGRVSLYVEDEFHSGFGYAYSESPIETRPEDYANLKLKTVTTESLEK